MELEYSGFNDRYGNPINRPVGSSVQIFGGKRLTHNVVICTKESKRVSVIQFESDGDWGAEAKRIANEYIERHHLVRLSQHIGNGDLTVWID